MKKLWRLSGLFSGVLFFLILTLHLWFTSILRGAPPPAAEPQERAEYYFAYGSNMSPQYLGRIRGVELQWSSAATVDGYRVDYGIAGLPWLEPAFASLRPASGSAAMGVVHRLSRQGLEAIAGSEGDIYRWRRLPVTTAEGQSLEAWTLVLFDEPQTTATPSRRYLKIMHDAGQHFDFPQDQLERMNPEQGVYVPVFSEAIGVVIQSATWLAARR